MAFVALLGHGGFQALSHELFYFLYQLMKEEPSPVMKETGAESKYPW